MKHIEPVKEFTVNRMRYEYEKHSPNAVVYRVYSPRHASLRGYEVHVLRYNPAGKVQRGLKAVEFPGSIRMPKNEDFGIWAWSCSFDQKVVAFEKFASISAKSKVSGFA